MIDGEILHGKLNELSETDDFGEKRESGLRIEYIEQQPPPTPLDCLKHDDWVSCLSYQDNW